MAVIRTAEGDELFHKRRKSTATIEVRVSARIEGGIARTHRFTVSTLYSRTADRYGYPSSRSDLTSDQAELLVNLAVGRLAADNGCRRADVEIDRVLFEEVDAFARAEEPGTPDSEAWEEAGSATERVRVLLDESPWLTDGEVALASGCSRSLVSDVKSRVRD
jgi:hypothetical protein